MRQNRRHIRFSLTSSQVQKFFREGSVVIVGLLIVFLMVNDGFCKPSTPAVSSLGGSPVIDPQRISQGYTLLALRDGAYLVDVFGKPVHLWRTISVLFHALLRKNGHIVAAFVDPNIDKNLVPSGGTGIIRDLDWAGNVVWEYKNELLHHDFEILPNGNIAALIQQPLTDEMAGKIIGGVPGTERNGRIFADAVIEIDRQGKEIWRWQASEHLDPQQNSLGPLSPRSDWAHANSIQYVRFDRSKLTESRQIDPSGDSEGYLVSLGRLNKVILVDKRDGKILWQYRSDFMSYQHDATLLPNGHVLLFDNGNLRKPNQDHSWGSRVIEVDPTTNEVIWEFKGGDSPSTNARFSAPIGSGAQRLPNGNTLVTDGPSGHLFEVTPEKKIVWDFLTPFRVDRGNPWPDGSLFKSRRYAPDEIDWPERLPSPMPTLSTICEKAPALLWR